jgi:hypothetical protein
MNSFTCSTSTLSSTYPIKVSWLFFPGNSVVQLLGFAEETEKHISL